jgi:hypothetical protein
VIKCASLNLLTHSPSLPLFPPPPFSALAPPPPCSGVVAEMEARGAKVVPVFAGGLDFSSPVKKFFYDPLGTGKAFVDTVVSLTGFALVGGPARQVGGGLRVDTVVGGWGVVGGGGCVWAAVGTNVQSVCLVDGWAVQLQAVLGLGSCIIMIILSCLFSFGWLLYTPVCSIWFIDCQHALTTLCTAPVPPPPKNTHRMLPRLLRR